MSKADWSWLKGREGEIQRMDPDTVAAVLTEGLAKIDEHLAAEVVDRSGTREVIITAGGEAELFGLVRELVDIAPSLGAWRFVALRPALGFEFEVNAGGLVFEAKQLSFTPIDAKDAPSQLAIRLLVPNPQLEDWATIGWSLIESGIGEELASRIAYVEIGKRDDDTEQIYALESLPGYVERHTEAG